MEPQTECTTLWEQFKQVPDWRKAKGQRYRKEYLLGLVCAALASGARNRQAIVDWIQYQAGEIAPRLEGDSHRLPSESTIKRMLRKVDPEQVEQLAGRYGQGQQAADATSGLVPGVNGQALYGVALDGKVMRGASAGQETVATLRLVSHGSGLVLAQKAIPAHSNETWMAQPLLAGRKLQACVVTADAAHTSHDLAQQIVDQGGDYLLVVKPNQAQLYADIALLFSAPCPVWDTTELRLTDSPQPYKRHGRMETRTLVSSTALKNYLNWPAVEQVLQRTCRRVTRKTGKVEEKVTYAITSLAPDRAGPKQLAQLWLGHWTIENRDHYVLDEAMGEDRCRIRSGHSAQVLSALRSAVLTALRQSGWHNITQALRFFAAHPAKALAIVGFPAL